MKLIPLFLSLVFLLGCSKDRGQIPTMTPVPVPTGHKVIGWNPATMRCQDFDNGKFHGEFHPDDDCAGMEKPKAE